MAAATLLAVSACAPQAGQPPSAASSLDVGSPTASSSTSLPATASPSTPASAAPTAGGLSIDACAVFTKAELEGAFRTPMAAGVPTLPPPSGTYGFCVVRPVSGPGSISITVNMHIGPLAPDTPGEQAVAGLGMAAVVGNGRIAVNIRDNLGLALVVYMPDNTVGTNDFLISLART